MTSERTTEKRGPFTDHVVKVFRETHPGMPRLHLATFYGACPADAQAMAETFMLAMLAATVR